MIANHRIPQRGSRIARALAVLALGVFVAACTTGSGASAAPTGPAVAGYPAGCPTTQPAPLGKDEKRVVTIKTDKGDIAMEIDGALSPIATGNFIALADCGYYDGVVFHRVVPGFVIQGGDGQYGRSPNIDAAHIGQGGPPYTIQDEPVTTPYTRGTVAMARTRDPNSVGSQFFIVLDDAAATSLGSANTYQIIGKVTSGMDAVDAIAAAADKEVPTNPVVMTDVSVATP
jgi:cyclophilin family peptidyl-prolyl cis-trans isomerase